MVEDKEELEKLEDEIDTVAPTVLANSPAASPV